MPNLLDIVGLSVDFKTPNGPVHALRNINFSVPKGKIIGVVGESGSGKSTLVWTIMRLLAANGEVTAGEICFQSDDVLGFGPSQLRNFRGEDVSIVFQDPMTSQIPVLNYRTQMTDILYRRVDMSKEQKVKAAIHLMRRVGIPDASERIFHFPHQFSGGMRQRAGIAMALLMDPVLLIADEPTTALDVTMEAQIIHLIREARAEFDSTIMIVSHNLGLIAELCDEIVVMYAGEIVEHAEVCDMFFNARHPYTQALLRCNPALEQKKTRRLDTIPGDVPDLHHPPAGCVFSPRCQHVQEVCWNQSPKEQILESGSAEVSHNVRCHFYSASQNGDVRLDALVHRTNGPKESKAARSVDRSVQPLLEIENLRVRFPIMSRTRAFVSGKKERFVDAVLNINLDLEAGETLGLVGESGSGKTTLGCSILGLNSAHSGSIKFKGERTLGIVAESLQTNSPQCLNDVSGPGRFTQSETDCGAAAHRTLQNSRHGQWFHCGPGAKTL